jgi:hypothetical protein
MPILSVVEQLELELIIVQNCFTSFQSGFQTLDTEFEAQFVK